MKGRFIWIFNSSRYRRVYFLRSLHGVVPKKMTTFFFLSDRKQGQRITSGFVWHFYVHNSWLMNIIAPFGLKSSLKRFSASVFNSMSSLPMQWLAVSKTSPERLNEGGWWMSSKLVQHIRSSSVFIIKLYALMRIAAFTQSVYHVTHKLGIGDVIVGISGKLLYTATSFVFAVRRDSRILKFFKCIDFAVWQIFISLHAFKVDPRERQSVRGENVIN